MLDSSKLKKFQGTRTAKTLREYFGMQMDDHVTFSLEGAGVQQQATLTVVEDKLSRWKHRDIGVLLETPLEGTEGTISPQEEKILLAYSSRRFSEQFYLSGVQWAEQQYGIPGKPSSQTLRQQVRDQTIMKAAYAAEGVACKAVFDLGQRGSVLLREDYEQMSRMLDMYKDDELMEQVYRQEFLRFVGDDFPDRSV